MKNQLSNSQYMLEKLWAFIHAVKNEKLVENSLAINIPDFSFIHIIIEWFGLQHALKII